VKNVQCDESADGVELSRDHSAVSVGGVFHELSCERSSSSEGRVMERTAGLGTWAPEGVS